MRPDDLAAAVIRALVDRVDGLDPATIDDVQLGNGNGAGEDNRNVGRMAALLAGLPTSVPGVTENRLCGSGLEAVAAASRAVAVGDAEVCIAGGVESMSRAPWVVAKPETGVRARRPHDALDDARLAAGQPRHARAVDRAPGRGCGDPGRAVRASTGRSRTASPCAATSGRQRPGGTGASPTRWWLRAGGRPRPGRVAYGRTPAWTLWRGCRPVFRPAGTVTAGNASPMNDGAAALLLASEAAAAAVGARAPRPHRGPSGDGGGASAVRRGPGRGGEPRAWSGPASAGPTWPLSSSTRPSPPRRWPASPNGPGSTGRSSTPTAGRSPSATRSGARGRGS